MGRKKFEGLSKDKKKSIGDKINAKVNEITRLKKSYHENFDIFEAVNDEMKDLFECNLTCDTCGPDDRGKCMQNFRMANIYFQRQCMILVKTINNYLEVFENILNGLGHEILGQLEEKPKEEKSDKDYYS